MWRRTNKWRYNKYQREYQAKVREKNLSGNMDGHKPAEDVNALGASGRTDAPNLACGSSALPAQKSKIAKLRHLIDLEHEKIVEEPVKPLIYRNDYGAVISEHAWKLLQKKKEAAAKGGYVLDDYSQ